MSKIFDLINELCPKGVEFRELGEIADIEKGTQLNKSLLSKDGKYPVMNGGINPSGYWHEYSHDADMIVISQGGASAGYVNWLDTRFFAGAHAFVINAKEKYILKRYAFHYLKRNQQNFMQSQYGAGIPALAKSELEKFKLPVPPMEVQREIVRILDSFTLLTAELTAELTARKKQYEFYRDFLLSFDELDKNGGGCELKMLGEICDLIAGGDISKDKVSKEKDIKFKFPIYSNGIGDNALYGFTDEPRVMKQCVTISARGTIGYCALRLDPFYPIVRLICAIPKSNITAQFLKYFLDTQKISVPTSGIPQLTIPMVAKIKIPIPSLQTQQKVVDILDKFDTLVNSITEGLPREIELRRKQYEYYREKLLNFTELKKEI